MYRIVGSVKFPGSVQVRKILKDQRKRGRKTEGMPRRHLEPHSGIIYKKVKGETNPVNVDEDRTQSGVGGGQKFQILESKSHHCLKKTQT